MAFFSTHGSLRGGPACPSGLRGRPRACGKARVLGHFGCRGKVDPRIIEMLLKKPEHKAWGEEAKGADSHPDAADPADAKDFRHGNDGQGHLGLIRPGSAPEVSGKRGLPDGGYEGLRACIPLGPLQQLSDFLQGLPDVLRLDRPRWAMSGRPPPLPPTTGACSLMMFPAWYFPARSFVTMHRSMALSPRRLPRRMIPDPACPGPCPRNPGGSSRPGRPPVPPGPGRP